MAAGSIIIDLLMNTGSFETDTQRAANAFKKIQQSAKDTGKSFEELGYKYDAMFNTWKKVESAQNAMTSSLQKSQSGFRSSNQVIQNTSYQLTDFIVQVSGGTSALRAFSQQAPQFLGAFGGWGAIAGIVAAIGGALGDLVVKMNGTKSIADTFKDLEAKSNDLDSAIRSVSKIDLSDLGKNYREADKSSKELIESNIRYARLALEISQIDATAGLKKGIMESLKEISTLEFYLSRAKLLFQVPTLKWGGRTEATDFAGATGLSEETARKLQDQQAAFANGKIKASEYKNALNDVLEANKNGSDALKKWIDSEQKRADAMANTERKLDAINRAEDNRFQGLENNSAAMEKYTSKVQALKEKLADLTYGKTDTSELAAFNDRYAAGLEKVTVAQADVLRGIYAQIDAQTQLNQDTTSLNELNAAYDSYSQKLQKIYDDQMRIYDLRKSTIIDETKEADLIAGTQQAIDKLNDKSMKLGMTMQQAFGSAIQQAVSGIVDVLFEADKSFSQFVDGFVKSIGKMIMQLMILQGIKMMLGGTSFGDFLFGTKSANGNVFDSGGVKAFANGGVFTNSIISKPTAFAYGGAFGAQAGLMGEAGPEAVVPLKRSSTGKLGVGATPSNVVINISNEAGGDGYKASANVRKNDGKFDIDILISKAVTSDIRNNGPMAQAMTGTFGLRRSS